MASPSSSNPAQLTGLTPREGAIDAVYRALDGYDHRDKDLYDSAFLPDAVFHLLGSRLEGLETISRQSFDVVAPLDTSHHLSNIRVHLTDGDTRARLTCTALSNHFRPGTGMTPGAPFLMAGTFYDVALVRTDGGLWKVKEISIQGSWANGDWGVMSSASDAAK